MVTVSGTLVGPSGNVLPYVTITVKALQSVPGASGMPANASFTDSSGIIWEGGMSSGDSIFLGCQLAQQSGATTITLYDAAKAPHSMTIAEGMAVAALIGAAYQAALGTKNSLYAKINTAKTVKAVQGVVW